MRREHENTASYIDRLRKQGYDPDPEQYSSGYSEHEFDDSEEEEIMAAWSSKTGAEIKKEMAGSQYGDDSSEEEFPPPPDPDEPYQGDDDFDFSAAEDPDKPLPPLEVEEEDLAPIMYIPALPIGQIPTHAAMVGAIPPPQYPKDQVAVGSYVVPITVAFVFFLVASQL